MHNVMRPSVPIFHLTRVVWICRPHTYYTSKLRVSTKNLPEALKIYKWFHHYHKGQKHLAFMILFLLERALRPPVVKVMKCAVRPRKRGKICYTLQLKRVEGLSLTSKNKWRENSIQTRGSILMYHCICRFIPKGITSILVDLSMYK